MTTPVNAQGPVVEGMCTQRQGYTPGFPPRSASSSTSASPSSTAASPSSTAASRSSPTRERTAQE